MEVGRKRHVVIFEKFLQPFGSAWDNFAISEYLP